MEKLSQHKRQLGRVSWALGPWPGVSDSGMPKDTWLGHGQRIPESCSLPLLCNQSLSSPCPRWVCRISRASDIFPMLKKLPPNSIRSKNKTSFLDVILLTYFLRNTVL